jgi:hypothetical protein
MALGLAAGSGDAAGVGFVHIPPVLERRRTQASAGDRRLDWEGALAGGLEIIRACLGRPLTARRELERPVKPR